MKKIILAFVLAASPVAASEPVTITIDSVTRNGPEFVEIVVRAQNNTNTAYKTVFYRCTAFLNKKAIGSQLGIISNLRANGTNFDRASVEVPQRADTADCTFERIASWS